MAADRFIWIGAASSAMWKHLASAATPPRGRSVPPSVGFFFTYGTMRTLLHSLSDASEPNSKATHFEARFARDQSGTKSSQSNDSYQSWAALDSFPDTTHRFLQRKKYGCATTGRFLHHHALQQEALPWCRLRVPTTPARGFQAPIHLRG